MKANDFPLKVDIGINLYVPLCFAAGTTDTTGRKWLA
jgi:hypothetical protein